MPAYFHIPRGRWGRDRQGVKRILCNRLPKDRKKREFFHYQPFTLPFSYRFPHRTYRTFLFHSSRCFLRHTSQSTGEESLVSAAENAGKESPVDAVETPEKAEEESLVSAAARLLCVPPPFPPLLPPGLPAFHLAFLLSFSTSHLPDLQWEEEVEAIKANLMEITPKKAMGAGQTGREACSLGL